MPAPPEPADAGVEAAPRDRRPLGAVLAASAVSAAGSALTALAVPWLVLQTTGSAGRAGIVAACAIGPVVVSALAGGVLVDRAGSRRVSVAADLLSGAAVAAIPLLSLAGLLRFWIICVLMGAAGLGQAPGQTARTVMLPALARHAGQPVARVAGWYDGAARGASVLGAAAGGLLIAVLGPAPVLLADGASFAVSALLVAAGTRHLPAGTQSAGAVSLRRSRRDLTAGLRFVLRTRLLLAMSLLAVAVQFCDQGWTSVLLPDDARSRLGGAVALGVLEALFAAGALAGALAYSAAGARWRRWPLFTVVYLIVGAPRFLVAAGTATPLPLAVMMTAEGLACGVINPLVATVMFGIVPGPLRARVLAATTALSLSAAPLGTLAAGWLADSAGLTTALLTVGGVYLAATLCPAVFPVWRRLGREDSGAPAATGAQQALES
ncbi:MAG TPA: MFS transporter [Streptosporangiaceae bacterium]